MKTVRLTVEGGCVNVTDLPPDIQIVVKSIDMDCGSYGEEVHEYTFQRNDNGEAERIGFKAYDLDDPEEVTG